MKILDTLIGIIAPPVCIACQSEGVPLCEVCDTESANPSMCYRCKKPSLGGLTCGDCLKHSPISACISYGIYQGPIKSLVSHAKYGPSRNSTRFMGRLLAREMPYIPNDGVFVTYAPTTPSRIRDRGFDQSKLIAKEVAFSQKLIFMPLLRRLTLSHQVGANKRDRVLHMKDAFEYCQKRALNGSTVIIVDDVITTGATLEAAAKTLKRAGAGTIVLAVFARSM